MKLDNTGKALLIAAAVLLVAGIAALTLTGGSPAKAPSKPATSQGTPSAAPSETEAPQEPAAIDYPPQAEQVARASVLAYTQYSWRDPGPLAWMKRLEPLATPEFMHSLEETFAGDGSAQNAWRTDIKPSQRETRTEVSGFRLSGMHDQSEQRFVFVVSYLTSVRTKAFDWTTPAEPLSQFVTVLKTPAGWKATDMTSTSDRSGTNA